MPKKSLKNVRILANTIGIMGPTCGMWLADLGAEVIRVEPPPPAGVWGTRRGKKSLALNLKNENGKKIFMELAKVSDIILENYAPGAMERLGLGYEDIKKLNPKIIYCSISGYGHTGPQRDLRGFDAIVQGESGVMFHYFRSFFGISQLEPPMLIGTGAFTDYIGAIFSIISILAALHYREKTGRGQRIDISSLDAAVYMNMFPDIERYFRDGQLRSTVSSQVGYGAYRCKDGLVMLGLLGPRIWARALKLLQREDLLPKIKKVSIRYEEDPELAEEVDKILKDWLGNRNREDALKALRKAGCPSGPVLTIPEVVKHPQLRARGMFVTVDDTEDGDHVKRGVKTEIVGSAFNLSETPGFIGKKPYKEIGEDTEEILKTLLDYSTKEIDELEKEGAIKRWNSNNGS
jgi:crotonobetainyl-CoA:carnitine CoA-transferase CaiB-like acyl-CoA transferase